MLTFSDIRGSDVSNKICGFYFRFVEAPGWRSMSLPFKSGPGLEVCVLSNKGCLYQLQISWWEDGYARWTGKSGEGAEQTTE
jgi:hypothetical protein